MHPGLPMQGIVFFFGRLLMKGFPPNPTVMTQPQGQLPFPPNFNYFNYPVHVDKFYRKNNLQAPAGNSSGTSSQFVGKCKTRIVRCDDLKAYQHRNPSPSQFRTVEIFFHRRTFSFNRKQIIDLHLMKQQID